VSRVLNDVPDDLLDQEARALERTGYSIHFHVWTPISWLEVLAHVARSTPLDVLACAQNGHEFITVMRKEARPVPVAAEVASAAGRW
jgi:hypothetical protein